jgi:hypothetical protein
MEHGQNDFQPIIDPRHYGVSFSLKQCRNFGLDPSATLQWLLAQGWRRFRLMSYWDEHEPEQGKYDFAWLDWQIEAITVAGGTVSLCVGVKQPRWPEYHWPKWAEKLDKTDRDSALLHYVGTVVARYRDKAVIDSWQLENEALLQGFGEHIEIDRARLRAEYHVVKNLDDKRPIVMSTSNNWGIPIRSPRPNVVGFSWYFRIYNRGDYHGTVHSTWLHKLRKTFVNNLLGKPVFIHELQLEPWGPTAIWKMPTDEQAKSMDNAQIAHNLTTARKLEAYPIDIWGAEWWYWRWLQGDGTVWKTVKDNLL